MTPTPTATTTAWSTPVAATSTPVSTSTAYGYVTDISPNQRDGNGAWSEDDIGWLVVSLRLVYGRPAYGRQRPEQHGARGSSRRDGERRHLRHLPFALLLHGRHLRHHGHPDDGRCRDDPAADGSGHDGQSVEVPRHAGLDRLEPRRSAGQRPQHPASGMDAGADGYHGRHLHLSQSHEVLEARRRRHPVAARGSRGKRRSVS